MSMSSTVSTKKRPFLDLNPFGQIPVIEHGEVTLADYPEIRGWLARVEALPGFVPMLATKAGLAA